MRFETISAALWWILNDIEIVKPDDENSTYYKYVAEKVKDRHKLLTYQDGTLFTTDRDGKDVVVGDSSWEIARNLAEILKKVFEICKGLRGTGEGEREERDREIKDGSAGLPEKTSYQHPKGWKVGDKLFRKRTNHHFEIKGIDKLNRPYGVGGVLREDDWDEWVAIPSGNLITLRFPVIFRGENSTYFVATCIDNHGHLTDDAFTRVIKPLDYEEWVMVGEAVMTPSDHLMGWKVGDHLVHKSPLVSSVRKIECFNEDGEPYSKFGGFIKAKEWDQWMKSTEPVTMMTKPVTPEPDRILGLAWSLARELARSGLLITGVPCSVMYEKPQVVDKIYSFLKFNNLECPVPIPEPISGDEGKGRKNYMPCWISHGGVGGPFPRTWEWVG